MSDSEIEALANNDLLLKLSKQFLKLGIFENKLQCLNRLLCVANLCKSEFESVYSEPKLENSPQNRAKVKGRNSAPLVEYELEINNSEIKHRLEKVMSDNGIRGRNVMRKCMIYAIEEILNVYPNSVYIGEDVSHGGYYLVTDGLSAKYPLRIRDFPPDETALFGIGIGYVQSGLIPIVEMPYAKYLDCGADMFFEAIIMNWLSNGQQSNGLMFRLQGFGNGLFGGNFHTHNCLYIPPGLDVVCYSNGYDYINGWRYAIQQCIQGRCVMSVDCTAQLNNRHCFGETAKDGLLLTHVPHCNEYLTFDDVIIYGSDSNKNTKYILYDSEQSCEGRMTEGSDETAYVNVNETKDLSQIFTKSSKKCKNGLNILIVSYGMGVNASRQAQKELLDGSETGLNKNGEICDIFVIDCPYLSDVPKQLRLLFENDLRNGKDRKEIDLVLFTDMCKEGQNPLNAMANKLQNCNVLQKYEWLSIAAQYTYNPLGKDLTFLSKDDIVETALKLIRNYKESSPLIEYKY